MQWGSSNPEGWGTLQRFLPLRWPQGRASAENSKAQPHLSLDHRCLSWLLAFSQQHALILANFENINTKDAKGETEVKEIQIPHY